MADLIEKQLDYGISNRESEESANRRGYTEAESGDFCYPLEFLALDHFAWENGLESRLSR